jgi:hypothetical protein
MKGIYFTGIWIMRLLMIEMKTRRHFIAGLLLMTVVLFCASFVSADFAVDVTAKVSAVVCGFVSVFISIATGVAAVVMTLAGIKWIASENDPGARKAAKDTIIHAIVGMIIITIISSVIGLIIKNGMCGTF